MSNSKSEPNSNQNKVHPDPNPAAITSFVAPLSSEINSDASTNGFKRKNSCLAEVSSYSRSAPARSDPPAKANPRRLSFADEKGKNLAEIKFAEKLHYSKDTDSMGNVAKQPKSCCTIS